MRHALPPRDRKHFPPMTSAETVCGIDLQRRSASGRRLSVAPVSCSVPNDPKASPKGRIHAPTEADLRAPGPAGLRAFWVAGFGAFQLAGLRVESVAGLIGYARATCRSSRRSGSRSISPPPWWWSLSHEPPQHIHGATVGEVWAGEGQAVGGGPWPSTGCPAAVHTVAAGHRPSARPASGPRARTQGSRAKAVWRDGSAA